jgi:hypothetical protein
MRRAVGFTFTGEGKCNNAPFRVSEVSKGTEAAQKLFVGDEIIRIDDLRVDNSIDVSVLRKVVLANESSSVTLEVRRGERSHRVSLNKMHGKSDVSVRSERTTTMKIIDAAQSRVSSIEIDETESSRPSHTITRDPPRSMNSSRVSAAPTRFSFPATPRYSFPDDPFEAHFTPKSETGKSIHMIRRHSMSSSKPSIASPKIPPPPAFPQSGEAALGAGSMNMLNGLSKNGQSTTKCKSGKGPGERLVRLLKSKGGGHLVGLLEAPHVETNGASPTQSLSSTTNSTPPTRSPGSAREIDWDQLLEGEGRSNGSAGITELELELVESVNELLVQHEMADSLLPELSALKKRISATARFLFLSTCLATLPAELLPSLSFSLSPDFH